MVYSQAVEPMGWGGGGNLNPKNIKIKVKPHYAKNKIKCP